jgi:hypothetical protein
MGSKKKFTSGHAQFAAGFRNEDEIASSNFEEQVEEICLADSGGPGLGSVRQSLFVLEPISQIGNGCVAGDLALQQGARRKNILHGFLTDEQRRCSGKDPQPCGLRAGSRLAALLLSHRAYELCSFVAPCQPAASAWRTHSLFARWVLIDRAQNLA